MAFFDSKGYSADVAFNAQSLTDAAASKINSVPSLPGITGSGTIPQLAGSVTNFTAADLSSSINLAKQQASITGTTSGIAPATIATPAEQQQSLSTSKTTTPTNILHNYTDYTYRLSLYLLTTGDYASMVSSPDNFSPRHLLISSGGYGGSDQSGVVEVSIPGEETGTAAGSSRHKDFKEDFFIEDLNMTTIVGLNAQTKATNSIMVDFTIVEPYGMTLLDRIASACETTAGCTNYIEQPYLLEIEFLKNPDESEGGNQIKGTNKRIPIRFIDFKISPATGGTQYKIRAIPFNHYGFMQSTAVLPITLTVEANTLGEFFSDGPENKVTATSALSKWQEYKGITSGRDEERPLTKEEKDKQEKEFLASAAYITTSLPAAFNEYMRSIGSKESKINAKLFNEPPLKISFKLDDKFKDSPIVDPDLTIVSSMPMNKLTEGVDVMLNDYKYKDHKLKQRYTLNYGTDIINIVDRIMMASEYIKKQVLYLKEIQTQTTDQPKGNETPPKKYVNWFKIFPEVKLLSFDKSRNAYSKEIIYHIKPFKIANPFHPDFAKTRITKEQLVRSYNYLYTGKNEDIVHIDIDFNFAYYTLLSAFQPSKNRGGSNLKSESAAIEPNQPMSRDSEDANRKTDTNNVYQATGTQAQYAGQTNRNHDPKDHAIGSLASQNIYISSRGDMLNIKLKIVGDPAFIKQDDFYYSPASGDYGPYEATFESTPILPNGQIVFDTQQVFVQLLMKRPMDIDDNTGITNKQVILSNGKTADATFSGVYRVITVKNEFVRGKFEQTLDLIRMPNDILIEDSTESAGAAARQ